MKLKNEVYDILKWCLLTLEPALITLIATLGTIYKFDTEVILLTIGAISTFLGAILGISSVKYNKVNYESDTSGVDE